MAATTLAQEIQDSAVDFGSLEADYRPMLKLVEQLIGVVPNCDPYLEIWPVGFRSYNLLVPNLLNLPGALVGAGAPKDLVGLAMYASSRAAECMYCSAHTCSFALRRGASPDALVGNYSAKEAAVARVAEGMSRFPAHLERSDITDLRKYLSESDIEWVVLGVALMGFLNKFMDTMGIELEQAAIDDVADLIAATGWDAGKHGWTSADADELTDQTEGRTLSNSVHEQAVERANNRPPGYTQVQTDGLGVYLKVMRQAPAALRMDRRWTKGMSSRGGSMMMDLEQQLGFAPSALAHLSHNRAIRALGTVIRDNLNPETTALGLGPKCLVALVYGRMAGNDVLVAEAVQMTERLAPEISHNKLAAISRFATMDMTTVTVPPGLTTVEAGAVMLAKAAAPSPSEINPITIATAASTLSPPQLIELVSWLSVQQLLQRIQVFFDADGRFDDV